MSMIRIVKSEMLKLKHGFPGKLVWLSPLLALTFGVFFYEQHAVWPRRAILLVYHHPAYFGILILRRDCIERKAAAICNRAMRAILPMAHWVRQNAGEYTIYIDRMRHLFGVRITLLEGDCKLAEIGLFMARQYNDVGCLSVADSILDASYRESRSVYSGRA